LTNWQRQLFFLEEIAAVIRLTCYILERRAMRVDVMTGQRWHEK
jgi:hypothetical protein